MQRKLVKQGAATMMISLPSKWIQKNKLDKGDEVELIDDNNKLIISKSSGKGEAKRSKIDISGLSPLVNRSLIALYIQGADEIEVNFSNRNELKDLQKKVLPELIGFEIIKQTSSSFILKDVTGSDKQEIDSLIKRVFLILDSIAEEIVNCYNNKLPMDSAIESDLSVNRLINFCLRIVNKKGYVMYDRTTQIYGILNQLEEIGDNYKKIAKFIGGDQKSFPKKYIQYIEESRKLLKLFDEVIFQFDKKKAVECSVKYQGLVKDLKESNIVEILVLQLLVSIIRINNYLLVFSLGKE